MSSATETMADPQAGRVLATLNADGSRRWLKPRLSQGRFLRARRIVAYALILIFAALPHIRIAGEPAMLLDIVHRKFVFFGAVLLPTDTVLLALLFMVIFVSVFLLTALFGRVWCGWACPQTVYMEFLYRPLERLIEGRAGRLGQKLHPARWVIKHVVFFVCACFLAHTFLAYFVGADQLATWVTRSPVQHPTSFLVMASVTGLMFFDFAWFREQTCLVACPYGRFQAAMLDRHSLIITYDSKRGEPRGRARKATGDVSLRVVAGANGAVNAAQAPPVAGDCIDCRLCVTTCPTGIDIREGLQMECIGCAQCIDACDAVMAKIGRPVGLIRYSSQAAMEGKPLRMVRARTILYPAALTGLVALFVFFAANRGEARVEALPRQGAPFYPMAGGEIANQVRVRIVNRAKDDRDFRIGLRSEDAAAGLRIVADVDSYRVKAGASEVVGLLLTVPPDRFSGHGDFETALVVTGPNGFTATLPFRALGPVYRAPAEAASPPTEHQP